MEAEIRFFSATGTTKKIVEAFAKGLNCNVQFIDFTRPEKRQIISPVESDLAVIAVPVYGKRIPLFIRQYLKHINGNGKPLIAIAVYGNAGYGISLLQFNHYSRENNFRLIGAGTFIGEHSYANAKRPVGYGRPDQLDLELAYDFGTKIREKFNSSNMELITVSKSIIPGFIAKMPDSLIKLVVNKPVIKTNSCNNCGICIKKCPMNAIDKNTLQINNSKCIRCFACVKGCPMEARNSKFRIKLFELFFKALGRKRKENHIIIS